MGTSENHRENGQDHHLRLHPSMHTRLDSNPLSHAAAAAHMRPLDARGQVCPADWRARTQLQQQHLTKAATTESHVAARNDDTSDHVQSMDVDHQFDGPETDLDRISPVSPSSVVYDRSAPFGANATVNMQQQQQHPLPKLQHSHFATPVMRFKAAHGYVRKHDEPPPADPACQSPVSASSGGIRLPSFAHSGPLKLAYPGTPPLSPRHWSSTTSTSSPRSSFGEPFPSPRVGFSLTAGESMRQVFPSNNRAGFTAPSSPQQQAFTLAPLRRGCESPASGSGAALPSLASLASSLPDSSSRGRKGSPSFDQVGGPFQYERSQSCPSDEFRAFHAAEHYHPPEPTNAPLYVLKSSVPKSNLVRSYSVDGETAAALRPRSLLAPLAEPAVHTPRAQPLRRPCEPDAIERWLEPSRQSLSSLAESAHALHLLERSRSPSLSSGPSSPMSVPRSVSGGMSEEDEGVFPSDPKREKKLCSFPQCTSNAVTRGKCISHGGGRRCQRKGCTRGAQSKGLCVAHGGGRICHERGCSNIQRSMGLCIRHGGGKRCSMPGCQKGVVRQDLCTAHGGKRKCRVEDCTKHVKKRGLCRSHANSMHTAAS